MTTRTRAIIRGSLKTSFIERNLGHIAPLLSKPLIGPTKEIEVSSITTAASQKSVRQSES